LLLLVLSNAWYNSILNSDTPCTSAAACTSMAPPSTKLKCTRDDGLVILKLLGMLKIWYVCVCLSSLSLSLSLSHTHTHKPTPSFYSLFLDWLIFCLGNCGICCEVRENEDGMRAWAGTGLSRVDWWRPGARWHFHVAHCGWRFKITLSNNRPVLINWLPNNGFRVGY
jgi:hypothetical protein